MAALSGLPSPAQHALLDQTRHSMPGPAIPPVKFSPRPQPRGSGRGHTLTGAAADTAESAAPGPAGQAVAGVLPIWKAVRAVADTLSDW